MRKPSIASRLVFWDPPPPAPIPITSVHEKPCNQVEIKTCELCGKLFQRLRFPVDAKGRPIPQQRDCAQCISNPPKDDPNERSLPAFRSYHLHGDLRI